jgi:hypothetical protein
METKKVRSKPTVVKARPAGESHQVVRILGGASSYRKKPCDTCPWRKDAVIGEFPAEAYRISANTAYDMAKEAFSCHESGTKKPATCAGFLLRGADHNLGVRIKIIEGRYHPDDVSDEGLELYDNYREMAIANGVDPDDEALKNCRD